MPNILTPMALWKNFDDSLETKPVVLAEKVAGEVKYEYVTFLGRETGGGRVSVFGVFASHATTPSRSAVLVLPDGGRTADEGVLDMFVRRGYSALMVDYRGRWDGVENFTRYPDCVSYANYAESGRHRTHVDDGADKTSWYEWVAVGIYARKYLTERTGGPVGVVGIRDGGEVVWKLAYAAEFSCAVTVCAAGWKAYAGCNKFAAEEPELDEERYRFIAGVDSQSYAPYVKCPVLMLCSTNDPAFDYDRAYDTFSRINPQFADSSVIDYSVKSNACIGVTGCNDMFMFLDCFVKQRHVFIPQPVEISVALDENSNLIAKAACDGHGQVEKVAMFMAEDCKNSALRDWIEVPLKGQLPGGEYLFDMDIYEGTTTLFALCLATYSNGFTAWSKIAVKKVGGAFANSRPACKVMYTGKNGRDCFSIANYHRYAVGGTFILDDDIIPRVVEKEGVKGIYSVCGLSTYRFNSPRFAPRADSILKLDVFPDGDTTVELTLTEVDGGEEYRLTVPAYGGVWQSVIAESKLFKNKNGKCLEGYTRSLMFTVSAQGAYAVNNVMWL